MASPENILDGIVARKRLENARRRRHLAFDDASLTQRSVGRAQPAYTALSRGGRDLPHVIAEIKMRSPSAGEIRKRTQGAVADIARQYERGGASAVSVLCDGPGFGGSVLDVRRASGAVGVPVLFKEFVLDPVQLAVACEVGASMVLLLVRALPPSKLTRLVALAHDMGLAPVVEAADDAELDFALGTGARIVGVNARDLRTFRVDLPAAQRTVSRIPPDRIAVFMSGIRSADDLSNVASGRADAVLVGEGLMRADEPGERLRELLATATPTSL